jgi:hypothetical protein
MQAYTACLVRPAHHAMGALALAKAPRSPTRQRTTRLPGPARPPALRLAHHVTQCTPKLYPASLPCNEIQTDALPSLVPHAIAGNDLPMPDSIDQQDSQNMMFPSRIGLFHFVDPPGLLLLVSG